VTAKVSELADSLMRDASGLQRRPDALLERIESVGARALDAATMRLQLLGAVITALSVALENDGDTDDAALAENARQLRLLLLDCVGSQPN